MKKVFLISFLLLMTSFLWINAQEAQVAKYPFDSKLMEVAPGVSIVLDCSTQNLKEVVDQRINDETNKSIKKFRKKTYQVNDAKIGAISGDPESYYFKIDRQGSNQSRLTLFISDKEEGFISEEEDHSMVQ